MGVINSVSNTVKGLWLKVIVVCLFFLPGVAAAADDIAESLGLPESRHLAAALADPESRMDTLLTLIAVQRLMDYGRYARPHEVSEYANRFTEERIWLDRLSAHYDVVPVRSSLFDPAAWLLLLELDQHDLSPGPAVSPFGPGTRALMQQLFDRTGELPASTVLPEILSRMEAGSTSLWNVVLQSAAGNVALARILQQLNEEWFDIWMAAEPPAPGSKEEVVSVVGSGLVLLEDIATTVRNPGPPDPLDLKRLRFSLLKNMPELGWQEAIDAGYLLTLANAVDGLYQKQYLAFTESLLWVAAGLLASELPEIETPVEEPVEGPFRPLPEIVLDRLPGGPEEVPPPEPYHSPIPSALVDLLPALSSAFASGFEGIDPRLNTALTAAFDVVEYIHSGQGDPDQLNSLRMGIADSVAQIVLLIPDMDYYFSQPVRTGIAEEINICISSAASRDELGRPTLRRDQFDRCFNNLAGMASTLLNSSELAGDPDGPFGMEQLRRELMLMPWQRINYVLGYLLETYPTGCEAPDEELPNPLEWSSLVTVLTWFARQSPVYFQASENEALVAGLRQQGRDMLNALVRQVDCIAGAGPGINDPVVRGLADYQEALESMVSGVRDAELEFREERLKPGADIVLDGDAGQFTAYRTEGLSIGPCDERYICEMAAELEATRELVGLFPNAYLVADQAGMGAVGVCYDNVQWIERRSEPVREDDPHVANYFGRFSFDLFGTFTEGEEAEPVFGFNFVTPEEYHYLFGAAGDEVLNDRCPSEWVGTRIMTPLGGDRPIRVVPDRLTYLTAARTLPSQLMGNNWDRNEMWRDAFISGQGVKSLELEADNTIEERVGQFLQDLSKAGQNAVYNELLRPPPRTWRGESESLYGQLRDLSTYKALVQTHINLFYPLFMVDSDGIRGSLEGSEALLDDAMVRRFRRENIAVSSINSTGNERLEKMHSHWSHQPETVRRMGSVATSLVHAITRLDSLYRDFFQPPPPVPPAPVREEDLLSFDDLGG